MSEKGEFLFVMVHGIGQQPRYSTLRWLIEGSATHLAAEQALTVAELATADSDTGVYQIPKLPVAFTEFNYADAITNYKEFAERDVMSWIGSFTTRLNTMNNERGGPKDANFEIVGSTIDDLLFATKIARFLGDRFRVEATSVQHTAIHFLQQIQLYLDLKAYRDDVNDAFQLRMKAIEAVANKGNYRIHLICHSLGTVVALRGLLHAAQEKEPWVKMVDRFVTFGSPIDLILLLYPKIFNKPGPQVGKPIQWTNYCLGNDPIATDLAIARAWVAEHAPALFQKAAPNEVHLGSGSITEAHTEYCDNAPMLNDIYQNALHASGRPDGEVKVESEEESAKSKSAKTRSKQPVTSIFHWASVAAAVLAAGSIVLWWEENIKSDDADRRVVLGDPIAQLICWIALAAMVMTSVWAMAERRLWKARFWKIFCTFIVLLLIAFMPGLQLLGNHLDKEFPPTINPITEQDWKVGNFILALVPVILLFHHRDDFTPRSGPRGRTPMFQLCALGLLTVFLSLFVGTRDNPSNLVDEFSLLAITFGLWWLSLLLARIDLVFSSFVGDRWHLDTLAKLWKEKSEYDSPRAPHPFVRTPVAEDASSA